MPSERGFLHSSIATLKPWRPAMRRSGSCPILKTRTCVRIDLLLKRAGNTMRSTARAAHSSRRGKRSAALYELRALARAELKDFPGAIDDRTYAIALRPEHATALDRRGWLYISPTRRAWPCTTSRRHCGSIPRAPMRTTAEDRLACALASTAKPSPTPRRRSPSASRTRSSSTRREGLRARGRRGRRRSCQERAGEPELEGTLPGARGDAALARRSSRCLTLSVQASCAT